MHADTLPPPHKQEPGWGLPLALAVLVHVLVALVFIVAWLWSPERNTEAAAGDPSVEASLALSSSEAAAARHALRQSEKLEDLPEPVAEPVPVPEDTIPPPQPIEEPRPQDAPTPQQQQAQERVAQPDTKDQEAANALAISQEKAKQEQEAKRRQEQIDLTERKRQEEAEQKARLAKQQEEDAKKKIADQQKVAADKAEAERQKKIADIRAKREQAEKEAKLAEQKLRQVAAARNAAGTTPAGSTAYNYSAHGPVLPLGSHTIALTPLAPYRPRRWRGAILKADTEVRFRVLDPYKRPVSVTADSHETRDVVEVTIRESKEHRVTLLFDPEHNLEDRILSEQFVF